MIRILFSFMLILISMTTYADDIAVTVYNSNLGVISENRSLEFKSGINRLAFSDVPSSIDPASVRFEVIDNKGNINILEQNYAYDLVNPQKMYDKYIDKEIELIDKAGKVFNGTLLAYNSGAVTLSEKSGSIKIVQLENISEVNFPSLPDGLITRPTLFWQYSSDRDGKLDCRVGYQTSDINWSAEYVGVLSSDEKNLGLSGWASIDNSSGKTYHNATLKLIAGDINRVQQIAVRGGRYPAKSMTLAETDSYAGFEEKEFFEYHMYTLPRKATVADKEIKQISLFEPAETTVEKAFIFRPERNAKKVEVVLKFNNSKETGLGLPLPAGRVRIFKADNDASLILLGEDMIDHTPVNKDLKLNIGYAFDITAEEKIANRARISSKVEEHDYETTISNKKKTPVTVEIEKKLYGFWEILETNFPFDKKDANTVNFKIPVDSDGTIILKYKVRYNFM